MVKRPSTAGAPSRTLSDMFKQSRGAHSVDESTEHTVVAVPQVVDVLQDQTVADAASCSHATPVVTCLQDEFKWSQNHFHVAASECEPDACSPLDLFRCHIAGTYSTAFSGIDAVGVATNMLCASAQNLTDGSQLVRGKHLCAIEWNGECITELKMMPHGPCCCFGNVMSFCSPDLQMYCKTLAEFGYEELKPMFIRPGQVGTRAHCYMCDKECNYRHTHGHIQGSPCTDFSSMGAQKGTNGSTICFWLAWAALMLLVRPFWLICENVKGFPTYIVEDVVRALYDVHSTVLCGTALGKAGRRERRYTLLTLRSVVSLTRSLSDVVPVFGRRVAPSHTWRNYLLANEGELKSELNWAFRRTNDVIKLDDPLESNFEKALLDTERERKQAYLDEYNGQHKVLSLGQNPCFSQTMSSETTLHCITRSCHIMWSADHNRWLTVREMLLAQGFPTFDVALSVVQPRGHVETVPMTSFNIGRIQRGFSSRQRVSVSHQCGNTMQVDVVGTILFWVALYVRSCAVPARPLQLPSIPMTPERDYQIESQTETQTSDDTDTRSHTSVPSSVAKKRRTSSMLRSWSAESSKCRAGSSSSLQ